MALATIQKPGPLTAAEWKIMKTHARLGSDAIEQAESDAEQPAACILWQDMRRYFVAADPKT